MMREEKEEDKVREEKKNNNGREGERECGGDRGGGGGVKEKGSRVKSYPGPAPAYVYPPSGQEVVTTRPSNCSV